MARSRTAGDAIASIITIRVTASRRFANTDRLKRTPNLGKRSRVPTRYCTARLPALRASAEMSFQFVEDRKEATTARSGRAAYVVKIPTRKLILAKRNLINRSWLSLPLIIGVKAGRILVGSIPSLSKERRIRESQ